MVPVKIELKNFMCYKSTSLDLTGVHLACLSGDNGAGKSAMFDAMTWTLWGEARAETADDLIAQGEIEMQATLDFNVGEQLYRVKRYRNKKGAGRTVLSFAIQHNNDWRDVSGSTVSETQKKIIEVLKMRYEVFINSAFLKQGKADEFTIKTPAQRKQVLAEILGLSYYDELEKKAKDRAKEADNHLKEIKNRLEEIEIELKKRPAYEAQKAEAELQLDECTRRLGGYQQNLNRMRGEEGRLKAKEEEQRRAAERLREIQERLRAGQKEQEKAHFTLSESQKVLARRAEIEQGFSDLQQVNEELEALNFKAERHLKLQRQEMVHERAINKERVELESRIGSTMRDLENARSLSATLTRLEPEFTNLQKDLAFSVSASEDLTRKQGEVQSAEAELKFLENELKRFSQELKVIEAKATGVPKPGDVCDRCGTVLTEEARDTTLEKFREEYRNKREEKAESVRRQQSLQTVLEETRKAVRELEKPARERSRLEKQAGILEEKLNQARKAAGEVLALEATLESYTQDLNAKQYALKEQSRLAEVQGEIEALNYDEQAHKATRARQQELKPFQEQYGKLRDAEKDQEWARKDLTRLEEEEQKLKQEEGLGQQEVERLKVETSGLEQLRERIKAEERLVTEAEGQEKLIRRNLMVAENNIENCKALEEKKKQLKFEYDETGQAKSVYAELAEAFGKKGLQALVIDTVLPELEEETNRLLGDMSDGRMSVRFDTQRDSKKGEVIETLDLRISDEQGSRPYEMFSGGEAFRVNFAVRVALSKLLARRSGAQLRTLIIDEGFGSQDGQGRERLVEAIRGIEDDFERVLVITHLQELKDVFPVRIDVVKTASGSQVSVN